MFKKFLSLALCSIIAACGGGGDGGGFTIQPDSLMNTAAAARPLQAVTFGVQWPTGQFNFAPSCRAPNSGASAGGGSCWYFPNGGRIWNIAWQSSVKPNHDEVLLLLIMSHDGQVGSGTTILSTHHIAGPAQGYGSVMSKEIVLQGFVQIPAGFYVWVYGEGWVDPAGGGVEVQTTLYVDGADGAAPVQ